MCFLSMTMAVYIHVLMAYIIHYFLNSFQSPLPWTVCKKAWKNCFTDFSVLRNMTVCDEVNHASSPTNCTAHPKHAAEYYFYEMVTGHHIPTDHQTQTYGLPSWELSCILVGSWFFVTLCTCKGLRYTSKVVYLTVLSPFLGFLIIIIRGAMLEGSSEGIRFMFHSDELFHLLRIEASYHCSGTPIFRSLHINNNKNQRDI
ncbi:hypothetical protein V1264_007435 [Littorina saxatilis]|uniref:Uncharacterized protein n=2 Tax=Littorina saxatilis TaxID=31220 RepID=A0AAN9G4M6_9CAEN